MKTNHTIGPPPAARRRWLSRRQLLQWATLSTGLALGGGILLGRRLYAREQLKSELVADASATYALKHQAELTELPAIAREQIREYFHGICLNVHEFVTEVCSVGFGSRIRGCRSEQEKLDLCHVAFSQCIVTPVELLNRIDVIAAEIGTELDLRWRRACLALQAQWAKQNVVNLRSEEPGLAQLIEPLILKRLAETRQSANNTLLNHNDLGDLGVQLGASALRLLPIIRIRPEIGLPVFLVTALVPLWAYLVDHWNGKAASAQFEISERLALLGNRVGAEFESEIRQRITQLQQWQLESFAIFAEKHAAKVIPLWF